MTEFIGREVDFALAVEAQRGVAESAAQRTVRKVTCNLIPRAERVIDDTTFGRLEDAERVRTVRRWSEGDVTGIVHADVIGYDFLNLYGQCSSAPISDGVHGHEFTLAQNIQHPTLTGFVKDGSVRQVKIPGMVISSLELTATTDNYLRYTKNFIGKEGVPDSAELPPLEREYDFVSRDIAVRMAPEMDSDGQLDAAPLKLKDLTLTWNPNAAADFVFGSYSPDNIHNKQFSIEGQFTRNFTDETFKDLYESDGFRYMSIDIEGEADITDGGSTPLRPKIGVLLHKIQITDWNRSSNGDELSTETVNFKAFLNTEDGEQSLVTLQNLTESYEVAS